MTTSDVCSGCIIRADPAGGTYEEQFGGSTWRDGYRCLPRHRLPHHRQPTAKWLVHTTGAAERFSKPSASQTSGSQPGASSPSSSQDGQQQPAGTSSSQTPQQSGAQNSNNSVQQADQTVQQQDNPNVKAGSKDDVDAIGNRNVGKGPNFYSLEREIALGKQLAQEVERTSKLIDDPVVTEYVNRVGQNLVRNSDAKVPFTIKVIDSDEVNAFALPRRLLLRQ